MAYEFRWRDLDHACSWRARGATEEEVIGKIAEHVRKKHRVKTPTDTIVNFVRANLRQS